jgi:peptide/nickel transport system ATP-binding protein
MIAKEDREIQTAEGKFLLEVKGLKKYFEIKEGWLKGNKHYLKAVDGVDFQVKSGETLGSSGIRLW